jgi:hypothetical protein
MALQLRTHNFATVIWRNEPEKTLITNQFEIRVDLMQVSAGGCRCLVLV